MFRFIRKIFTTQNVYSKEDEMEDFLNDDNSYPYSTSLNELIKK